MNDTAIHTTLHIFSDDIQSILGSFSAVDHKRKLLFSGNVKLGAKHFLLDLMFLFWSISVGIICGAGLAQVAVILSVVMTLGILILDRLPVARAPMIFVVNADNFDAEDAVVETVRKYAKHYRIKSRNLAENSLDLVLELRTDEGGKLVREVMGLAGVTSASLLAHDGEVTF